MNHQRMTINASRQWFQLQHQFQITAAKAFDVKVQSAFRPFNDQLICQRRVILFGVQPNDQRTFSDFVLQDANQLRRHWGK